MLYLWMIAFLPDQVLSVRFPVHPRGDVQCCHQSHPELWWNGREGFLVSILSCFACYWTKTKLFFFNFFFYCIKSKNKDEKGVPERGSVLVFLPGINEINSMQAALAKLLHKRWAKECTSAEGFWLVTALFDIHSKTSHTFQTIKRFRYHLLWFFFFSPQTAGFSSPFNCDFGRAEQCVPNPYSWMQEG